MKSGKISEPPRLPPWIPHLRRGPLHERVARHLPLAEWYAGFGMGLALIFVGTMPEGTYPWIFTTPWFCVQAIVLCVVWMQAFGERFRGIFIRSTHKHLRSYRALNEPFDNYVRRKILQDEDA